MPARSKPGSLLTAFLLVAMTLVTAGCLGASDGAEDPDAGNGDDNGENVGTSNATLPGGRGESSGLRETNRTEEGVGGSAHTHDYWSGRQQIEVFDNDVNLFPFPAFPDGEGSQPKSVAYVKLPQPNLVFEGTETVVIEFSNPRTFFNGLPHVLAPDINLEYRTAMDSDWREPITMTYDQPLVIEVDPLEADMPHSMHSLWVFRLTTDDPEDLTVHMSVIINRGAEILAWPGHPDFYAESSHRVVMDNERVSTYMSGAQEGILYDGGGTWVYPERLISWGTHTLHVFANVTRATNDLGAEPTGHFLEYHNATIIGPEITFGTRISDESGGSEDLKSWHFVIEVDPDGMDGPYQPESRWGFRLMATFANVEIPMVGGVGLCPGCFPYTIEYDMTIIAVGGDMEHEMR